MIEQLSSFEEHTQENRLKEILKDLGRVKSSDLIALLQGDIYDNSFISELQGKSIKIRLVDVPSIELKTLASSNPFFIKTESDTNHFYEISLDGKHWFDAVKIRIFFNQVFNAIEKTSVNQFSDAELQVRMKNQLETQISDYLYSIEQQLHVMHASDLVSDLIKYEAFTNIAQSLRRLVFESSGDDFNDSLQYRLISAFIGNNLNGSIAIGTFRDVEELILNMRDLFVEKAEEQAEGIISSFESRLPGISEVEFLDDDLEPYEGTTQTYLRDYDMSQFVDQGPNVNNHILSYYFVFLIADRIYKYKKNKEGVATSEVINAESRRKLKRDNLIEHISQKGISELELKSLQVLRKNDFSIQF